MDEFKDSLEQRRTERAEVISRITQEMNELRGIRDDLEKERALRTGLEKQISALKRYPSSVMKCCSYEKFK